VAGSINRVVLLGNLTRDPELRVTPGGTNVCSLRLAVNDRVKDPNTGEWGDKANYFNISVFGAQADRCAQWLAKGRQVAIDGRLRWREWQTQEGQKREAVEVVADNVQFIGPRDGDGGRVQDRPREAGGFADRSTEPPGADFIAPDDEDIPF
jgi:single-strand DNA-binding protein